MSLTNHSAHILLIEDESGIRHLLNTALSDYALRDSDTLKNARIALKTQLPDLIILDWVLPDGSGIDFLRYLKNSNEYSNIPVLMLTARATEHDIITGLDHGADDYLTKPFSLGVLQSRIKALLRRNTPSASEQLTWYDIRIDADKHRVFYQQHEIKLHRREFKLLQIFLSQPVKVHSREQLLDLVWGNQSDVGDRAVDVSIRRLRKAFADYDFALPITTLRGVGYRLDRPNTQDNPNTLN